MRALWREMLSLSERREPFAVCTVVSADGSVPGKVGSTMIVTAAGAARGTVGGAGLEERVKRLALDSLRTGKSGLHHFDLAKWKEGGLNSICGGSVDVSILVHRPLPHLLLLGGGHCAKALSDIAAPLEWDVTVVDGRAEYANTERFPNAVEAIAEDPVSWVRRAYLTPFTHAYLLGHSWETDVAIAAELVPRFHAHVGIIGSAAKRKSMFDDLLRRGVPAGRLERVEIPIGLPIGAESPEEIAVAIAASVLSRSKSGSAPPAPEPDPNPNTTQGTAAPVRPSRR